jgi:hypothetical protein
MKIAVIIFILIFGMFLFTCSDSSRQQDDSFGFLVGKSALDRGHDLIVTSQGDYLIGGESRFNSYSSLANPLMIMTHVNGDTVWTLTLPDTASITLLEWSNNNAFFAAGFAPNLFTMPLAFLAKINVDRTLSWKKTFSDYTRCISIKSTPEGGCIIIAAGRYDNEPRKIGLIKLTASGDLIWEKKFEYKGVSDYSPADLKLIGNGCLSLISRQEYPNYYSSYLIMTDNAGDTLWTKTLDQGIAYVDILTDHKGQLVLVGNGAITKYNKTYFVVGIARFDTLGNMISSKTIDVTYPLIKSVVETEDDHFLLFGHWGQGIGPLVMKVDSVGNWLMSKVYSNMEWTNHFSMTPCGQNKYVVMGTKDYPSYENSDIFVFTIDANGEVIQ